MKDHVVKKELTCKSCGEKEFYTMNEIQVQGVLCGPVVMTTTGKMVFLPKRIGAVDELCGKLACCGCSLVVGKDGDPLEEAGKR